MLWQATAIDGTEFNSLSCETFERVNERGGARSLVVWINEKPYYASCIEGESLHLFTRRAIVDFAGSNARQIDMPVIELRPTKTRLYLHPEHGPIFSTLDLNL
jgi:hypothetical protein